MYYRYIFVHMYDMGIIFVIYFLYIVKNFATRM